MSLNKKQVEKLESSGYRFVGSHNHAAAKICHWTKHHLGVQRLHPARRYSRSNPDAGVHGRGHGRREPHRSGDGAGHGHPLKQEPGRRGRNRADGEGRMERAGGASDD